MKTDLMELMETLQMLEQYRVVLSPLQPPYLPAGWNWGLKILRKKPSKCVMPGTEEHKDFQQNLDQSRRLCELLAGDSNQ